MSMKTYNDIPSLKGLQYITHDLGARNDPKLIDLQMEMGGQGLAIFWCLVEMLWENGGRIPANYKSIAFSLRWCKPAEVERVVTEFGLFQVEDGQLSSRSALARMEFCRTLSGARSDKARAAALARWNQRENADAIPEQCVSNAQAMQVSKLSKLSKLSNINNTPPTAADFYETFFFLNFHEPQAEAERFVKYYNDNGWKYTDGTPVDDPMKAAEAWKPAKPGKRFNSDALYWYKAVWNAAKDRVQDARKAFLDSFVFVRYEGKKILLTYTSKEAAKVVYDFINENGYAGEYQLEFRLSNK